MWHQILESVAGSVFDRLNLRRIAADAALLAAFVLTASFLGR